MRTISSAIMLLGFFSMFNARRFAASHFLTFLSSLFIVFVTLSSQVNTICLSLELMHLYTAYSRGEMEVTDIPTLKLRVERGIS